MYFAQRASSAAPITLPCFTLGCDSIPEPRTFELSSLSWSYKGLCSQGGLELMTEYLPDSYPCNSLLPLLFAKKILFEAQTPDVAHK